MAPLRIKVCGVTTAADARAAARAGADAVGLNFYPPSPRYVDVARVGPILEELPAAVEAVAVFAERRAAEACRLAEPFPRLRTVQLHGCGDGPEDGGLFRLIPAFGVKDCDDLAAVTAYLDRCRERNCLPAAVLVDARVPGLYGGTGQTAPWGLLADFRPPVPLILAGGLTPENVAEAVRTVRPAMVDVAGGVEGRPGVKDPDKMRRFIDQARSA
jgi:phosphoribosylanthranilate isomerase